MTSLQVIVGNDGISGKLCKLNYGQLSMTAVEANRAGKWRRTGTVPVILDLLVLVTLLALPVIWLLDPLRLNLGGWRMSASWGLKPLLFLGLVLLIRLTTVRGPAGLLSKAPVRLLLLAIYPAWIFLLLAEGVLALAGYGRPLPPILIQGEAATESPVPYTAFRGDADLGWALVPGTSFLGQEVNRLGFLDREVGERKPAGTRRVICLGDSCTAQGHPPYSRYLHDLLTERPVTGESWEAFNIAVPGYSSWQGLKLYRRIGRDLEPDAVTVYFGWNDHWASRRPDSIQYREVYSPLAGNLLNALQRKRFYSFLAHTLLGGTAGGPEEKLQVRVAPDEYLRNLAQLVDEIRADGAIPILITAPRTDWLAGKTIRRNRPRTLEDLLALHDRYADLTRRVAEEKKVELIDLDDLLTGEEAAGLFLNDGVHFRQEGLERIAAEIHTRLLALFRRGDL